MRSPRATLTSLLATVSLTACLVVSPDDEPVLDLQDQRIDGASNANDPESDSVAMCVDDRGGIIVVWVDDRAGQRGVWANRSIDGGRTWLETAVAVSHTEAEARTPSIACTGATAVVAWSDDRDGVLDNFQIYANRSTDQGRTWLEQDVRVELDDEGETMSLEPVVVARGQDAFVGWFDNQNGAYDILVSHSPDGGLTWEDPVRADSDMPAGKAWSAWPDLALTAAGQLHAVWEDTRDGEGDIRFGSLREEVGLFGEDRRLDGGDDAGSAASFSPMLAADGDDVVAVWHDERHGVGRDILLNASTDGGVTWQNSATRVEEGPAGFFDSLHPQVCADGPVAHVVWQEARDGAFDIAYRRFVSGEPQGSEQRLDLGDLPGFHHSLRPRIACDRRDLVVAWEDSRAAAALGDDIGYNDLFFNHAPADGAFAETDRLLHVLEPGLSYKVGLQIAVQQGVLYAAWADGRHGSTDIFFRALTLDSAPSPD